MLALIKYEFKKLKPYPTVPDVFKTVPNRFKTVPVVYKTVPNRILPYPTVPDRTQPYLTVPDGFKTVNNDFETVINPIGIKKCKVKILDLNKKFFIFYNSIHATSVAIISRITVLKCLTYGRQHLNS